VNKKIYIIFILQMGHYVSAGSLVIVLLVTVSTAFPGPLTHGHGGSLINNDNGKVLITFSLCIQGLQRLIIN